VRSLLGCNNTRGSAVAVVIALSIQKAIGYQIVQNSDRSIPRS
jgi:hypothetical protein